MSKLVELARQMRAAMDKAGTMLTDAQASTVTEIYPRLKDGGELVPVGTRIQWNGTIRRSRVDLWDAKENNPDNAPDLWAHLQQAPESLCLIRLEGGQLVNHDHVVVKGLPALHQPGHILPVDDGDQGVLPQSPQAFLR